MLVQINDKRFGNGYTIVHYHHAYATIAVNPYMPIRHKYLHFSLQQNTRTKITACNGEHEITIDHDNNVLLIKAHREYQVIIDNQEDMKDIAMLDYGKDLRVRDTTVEEDALHNITQAALWVATNSAYFKLARVNVAVNSNNLVIVVSLNTASARVIVEENEVLENYH